MNNYNNDIKFFTWIIYAFLYQWSLKHYLNIHLIVLLKKWKIIISVLNGCKIRGFVSHITNKFIDKKTNQRISGQILNMNKLNERKKAKAFGKSDEKSNKISTIPTGYTNRSENSIISNAAPSSLYENSFEQNKNNNTINDNNNNS